MDESERWAETLAGFATTEKSTYMPPTVEEILTGKPLNSNTPDDLLWLHDRGVHFALPIGRSKNKLEDDWNNKPHPLIEAFEHTAHGGNVSILTGKHSANVVALDRDVNFKETCQLIGKYAQTAKIVRDNAPERGKFLYRIVGGEIPPTASWKPAGVKSPEAEFLGDNGQRHALCAGSFDNGNYALVDKEYDILEITPDELDAIWRLITGGSIYKDVRAQEEAEAAEHAKNEYIQQVKEAWTVQSIFEHFNKIKNGTETEKGQIRVLGNGGLLISANKKLWYCHSDSVGGDSLDAWAWCKWGKKLDRKDPKQFWDVINDMGDAAGIERPQPATNTTKKTNQSQTTPTKNTPDMWLDALRNLPYKFSLNMLEDMVEVNGKRLDDVTRSKIYLQMVPSGAPKHYIDDLINVLASEHTYHPVQDYLNGLKWDGTDHLSGLMSCIKGDGKKVTYSNAVTLDLHSALMTRWLLGCAARALDGDKETAFKHQTPMLVIIGKQGLGKSSWVRWLVSGVGYEFHRESPINPHAPDDVRSMVTKWIWEASELGSSLRRGDRDALKGFITQEWHTYRKPWGRASITKPTLCNFVGTINPETGFLDDPTGHRRFLPVHITGINRAYEKSTLR